MNNGQLNMNMLEGVTLPLSSRLPVPMAATMDGTPDAGSDFAGLLQGIQLMTTKNDLPGAWQEEPAFVDAIGTQRVAVEIGEESPAVDLLVRLQAAPLVISASESAAPKLEDNESVHVEAEPLVIAPSSDVTSQMALAAYSQPSRMPEVNTPTHLTVDMLQNVATEQTAATVAPAEKIHAEQSVAIQAPATVLKPTAATGKESGARTDSEQNQHQRLDTPGTTAVDMRNVTTATTAVTAQPAPSDKRSIAGPSELHVERLQNIATVTEQPDVMTAPAIRLHTEQTAASPVQAPAHNQAVLPSKERVATAGAEQNQHKQAEAILTATADRQPATTVTAEQKAVQPAISDRTSEVNKPPVLPVDRLQNVATTEQPAVISAPNVIRRTEQTAAALDKEPVATSGAEQNQHRHNETFRSTAVDKQLTATVTAEQMTVKPATSNRTSEVINPEVHSVDRMQNIAPAIEQPIVFGTKTVVNTVERIIAEPVPSIVPVQKTVSEKQVITRNADQHQQTEPVRISAFDRPPVADIATSTTALSLPGEDIVTQEPKTVAVTTILTEKQVAAPVPHQSEQLSRKNATSYAPVLSPESELDIQMSQARPITAIVTTAPVFAEKLSAVSGRQQISSEQPVEKIRTAGEKNTVKVTASSLQTTVPANETMGSYDSSSDGEMNQNQSDTTSDHLILAQNMRGQLSTENQKVASASTKAFTSEPARQEVPEHVMQQVKERLVQHEVKPGNQQITLTLSPDNLGELKMNLNLQGQKLSVEIVTENRAVRDAIVMHTDALKESLARQNITMESFDVTTGGKGSGNQGQNQNAWRELAKQQQQQQLWTSPRGYNTAQADLPSNQAFHRQQGQSTLDIHY